MAEIDQESNGLSAPATSANPVDSTPKSHETETQSAQAESAKDPNGTCREDAEHTEDVRVASSKDKDDEEAEPPVWLCKMIVKHPKKAFGKRFGSWWRNCCMVGPIQ